MIIYRVQKGDTVYSLASRFGTTASRIINDNMLTNPGELTEGEDLVILYPTQTHTVMGGETLYTIAATYGTTVNTLYRNNPVLGGNPSVFPGQTLNISFPVPVFGEIVTMGYAYSGTDADTLKRTLPYLTYLAVFTYGIRENGTVIPPENGEEEALALCREYGTVPLLVLTSLGENGNFSDELADKVLRDDDTRDTLISSIVSEVAAKGYGGVNLDFEYVPSERAEDYVELSKGLKEALGGLKLVTSLAPKYSSEQTGLLYEGHIYPELGEMSDFVFLMTYEWGYTYGPPMAVAPIGQVERVVDYAVGEIPVGKILMGVPNYGYDWSLPYVRGESRATSLSNTEAVDRARQRGVPILYDKDAQSPYYSYYDRPRSYSDAVEHIVWFEDGESVKAKADLAGEKKLAGLGVWNVTKYFPALWSVINSLFEISRA